MNSAAEEKACYLHMAGQYPLLGEVISGETSFAGRLDKIGDDIWQDRQRNIGLYYFFIGYSIDETPLKEFGACLDTMVALSATEYNAPAEVAMYDYWERVAGKGARESALWLNGIGYGMLTVPIALALLLIPGGALIEGAIALLGGAGFVQGIKKGFIENDRLLEKREECEKALAPVYGAAQQLDSRIGRLFAADQFHECRENFERMYRALDESGRNAVSLELKEQLTLGALDMGEAELDSYLAGLAGEDDEEGYAEDDDGASDDA